jgi:hypothetical protein
MGDPRRVCDPVELISLEPIVTAFRPITLSFYPVTQPPPTYPLKQRKEYPVLLTIVQRTPLDSGHPDRPSCSEDVVKDKEADSNVFPCI